MQETNKQRAKAQTQVQAPKAPNSIYNFYFGKLLTYTVTLAVLITLGVLV